MDAFLSLRHLPRMVIIKMNYLKSMGTAALRIQYSEFMTAGAMKFLEVKTPSKSFGTGHSMEPKSNRMCIPIDLLGATKFVWEPLPSLGNSAFYLSSIDFSNSI